MPEPSASNYPASLDDNTTLFGDAVNLKQTALTAGIDAVVTTVPCNTAGVNVPCYVLINSELIYAPSKDASNFTSCTRAAGGTTAAPHTISTAVFVVYAANYHNQVKRALIAIETELGPTPSGAYTDVQDAIAQHEYWSGKPMQGGLINGVINRTVSSNNITVAVKTMNGADPSATDPVYVRIGDTVRSITASLSVTKNAGTNWCNSGGPEMAGQDIDYFVYFGYNATNGVTIGFARFPDANFYGDFNTTTTDEKYAAISVITNAVATDVYELAGRFNASLSAGAGFTWSIPATSIVLSRPVHQSRWLAWSPVFTGFSADPTLSLARYQIRMGSTALSLVTANGTSNGVGFTLTAPFSAVNTLSYAWGRAMDNGANLTAGGRLITAAGALTITIRSNFVTGAWTAALGKNVDFYIEYRHS